MQGFKIKQMQIKMLNIYSLLIIELFYMMIYSQQNCKLSEAFDYLDLKFSDKIQNIKCEPCDDSCNSCYY